MTMLEKARKLARYTEELAATPHWGVDDQDTLEWLISRAEELEKAPSQQAVQADAEQQCDHEYYGSIRHI